MEFKFVPDLVATNLSADDSSDAINKLSKLLTAKEYVSEEYAGKVIEREQEYPTGLQTKGPAIAIPHAFDDGIKGNHVAIGVLKNPVKFHSMEDMDAEVDVKIMFMLAIGGSHEQLAMLQFLMKVFQHEELLNTIATTDSDEKICDCLNKYVEELGEN